MSEEQESGCIRRIGRSRALPDEVAESVLYLVRNTFTTGAILDVDGGGRLH